MGNKLTVLLICAMRCMGLSAQQPTLKELAGLVADENTRQQVVSFVSASRRERIPLLMELTADSFPESDSYSLQIGLAEIFGELKVGESIPFLERHLILQRGEFANFAPWLKTEDVVLRSFPSVQALISIGPSAARALIKDYATSSKSDERLAAVFVVAHIRDVPEAIEFLKGISNPTGLERYYIDMGLKLQAH